MSTSRCASAISTASEIRCSRFRVGLTTETDGASLPGDEPAAGSFIVRVAPQAPPVVEDDRRLLHLLGHGPLAGGLHLSREPEHSETLPRNELADPARRQHAAVELIGARTQGQGLEAALHVPAAVEHLGSLTVAVHRSEAQG